MTASSLTGCRAAATPSTSAPTSPGANQQPAPSGSVADASVTITSTVTGSVGPAFAGLYHEKRTLIEPLFSASNANLVGLFKRLGPSVLRIGGNSVDRSVSFTAATTPALAAAEVTYDAPQLGSSLLGVEIGNGPDLYGNSYFAGTTWTVSTFEAL